VNVADKDGKTALMTATAKGHTEMAKLLLEKGTNVDVAKNDGKTALMVASANGHTEVVKLLLEKGAKVNATDKEGFTALMLASFAGHIEMVKLLMGNGADVNVINRDRTALELASSKGHTEVVKLLREKSASTVNNTTAPKKSGNRYSVYIGSGVCDVCNRSLSDVKAYIVPNNVFYSSPKWRAHFKSINLFGATDADIERMHRLDNSQGSAVCENCIHMF
jgi:ankyrin repeat protein